MRIFIKLAVLLVLVSGKIIPVKAMEEHGNGNGLTEEIQQETLN